MKKILITGASGLFGAKLYSAFSANPDVIIAGTYNSKKQKGLLHMDVTNRKQTMDVITKFHPDIVIHTVALKNPDFCEVNTIAAEKINYEGTVNVVAACKKVGARLDHISTIYVFDGEAKGIREEMKQNAKIWYGITKTKAEEVVQTLPRYGIYRSDKIFGFNGFDKENGYLSDILKGVPFSVNNDVLAHPVFAEDYIKAIQKMQELDATGIVHVAGPERMSKFELARRLAKVVGKESVVLGVGNKDQAAQRPDIDINTDKAKSLGITFTPIEEACKIIAEQIQQRKLSLTERESKKEGVKSFEFLD